MTFLFVVLAAFALEILAMVTWIKIIVPIRKEKEKKNNLEFMALYYQAHSLNDARNKKREELKELQSAIDKFSNFSHYLPYEAFKEYKDSLEPLKKQFYNVMVEIMDYDELIKKLYEEMDKIRKENKLKYL